MLYPEIETRDSGWLVRPDGHEIYWEETGTPDGIPVVFLHGGPGAGISPNHRRYFNPKKYRVILFDQRGAGKSRPFGSLENNTTPDLIGDIEALRVDRKIEKWLVFGGSWGSTLALAYGQACPARALGFVLRGIFLCRPSEIDWFMAGMGDFQPEAHQQFLAAVGLTQNPGAAALLDIYGRYFAGDYGDDAACQAARAWSGFEARCCTLLPDDGLVDSFEGDEIALALARLEHHYFVNLGFFGDVPLLTGIDKIRHLPATIIQGRYDLVCPPVNAFDLARAWPEAEMVIVDDAGHAASEPGTIRELVRATDLFAARPEYS
ncbi:prolyl aminopeptidase [Thalassospira mesophila]|uniref:Proline iminopeptidase n=1 Tax=Thalassospira mesophila TaxID=1293891 RepID=A0A1Y2L5K7_9PROT|nr:prolyl aminopeptidase [Thalassospira mesophila]OSQ40840.1 proline iminopeptidase [Thalassospira mesophila]